MTEGVATSRLGGAGGGQVDRDSPPARDGNFV
jgi:hypothetical protein